MLSPRTLTFDRRQMSWQCLKNEAYEWVPEGREPEGIWAPFGNDTLLRKVCFGLFNFREADSCGEAPSSTRVEKKLELYDSWYQLVRLYSSTDITKDSDRLPALSGLADAFQDVIQDTCMAGLWQADLQRGLLWSVSSDTTNERPSTLNAPTWAWASVVGQIEPHSFEDNNKDKEWDTSIFSIQAAECVLAGSGINPYGEVSEGIIQCNGLLKPAYIHQI